MASPLLIWHHCAFVPLWLDCLKFSRIDLILAALFTPLTGPQGVAHRGYRYLGDVFMLYQMSRKYLKLKST
jgi:hypothetical protein